MVSMLLLMFYMYKAANENNVKHHQMQVQGENEKLSVFFISDVHLRKINQKMIHSIDGSIDAVIIGGDFADGRTSLERINNNIALLQQLAPIYFVWGNNDREVGEEQLRQLFSKLNVTIVENNAFQLPGRKNIIWISAIDDSSTNDISFERALAKCEPDNLVIFVSHNPQMLPQVLKIRKPILMLGGHLHGGQIRFGKFGMHPHGSYSIRQGVPTLISNGYGTTLMPFRFGAKPECHIIDIIISGNESTVR